MLSREEPQLSFVSFAANHLPKRDDPCAEGRPIKNSLQLRARASKAGFDALLSFPSHSIAQTLKRSSLDDCLTVIALSRSQA